MIDDRDQVLLDNNFSPLFASYSAQNHLTPTSKVKLHCLESSSSSNELYSSEEQLGPFFWQYLSGQLEQPQSGPHDYPFLEHLHDAVFWHREWH